MADSNGSFPDSWYTQVPLVPAYISVNASVFRKKDLEGRLVVGVTCVLSIVGSILIILSYLLQKKRTNAKKILLQITLMDLGVSLTNLIGLSVYFDRFYEVNAEATKITTTSPHIDGLCKAQAFFAMVFSMGSVLWTTALAAYLYVVIIHSKKLKLARYTFWANFVVCYGLPVVVSIWSVLTGKLGYAPYDSSGWCSLITIDPLNIYKRYVFRAIFVYDMWIYVAGFLIIIIYVALKSFISAEAKRVQESYKISSKKFWSTMNHIDYKFIFIPVIFVLLRMWGLILDILYVYLGLQDNNIPTVIDKTLLYLSGIGDSGQGFTNAILFLLFTKSMWRSFLNVFRCRYGEIKDEETMSSGSDPNHSQVSVQTTSQNGEDADNNESKPFYVAALLSNNPPHYGSNVNQPV